VRQSASPVGMSVVFTIIEESRDSAARLLFSDTCYNSHTTSGVDPDWVGSATFCQIRIDINSKLI
jgi:hypothetical protein